MPIGKLSRLQKETQKYAVPYLLPKSLGLDIAEVHRGVMANVPADANPKVMVNVRKHPKLDPNGNHSIQIDNVIIPDIMIITLKFPNLSESNVGMTLPTTPAAL